MADGKVLLEVIVEGKNVKVVQREVEQVTNAVNQNTSAQERNSSANRQSASSQEQNAKAARDNARATQSSADSANRASNEHAHYDRTLKGIHQTNLSGAKSFSKIRDAVDGGSSGLVAAYATLAANMFAATAAFTALQKAAQVEQLSQGLTALGNASGIAMQSLSRGLQKATGYAVSLQDSMRSVAMITSAGFNPDVVERLGAVAKNTSIALGRDLQDSMNRLVKGAVKLEPELLDELGIMVRIDEASQMYAQSLGKNASQLTNFEKRQAFMNAVLAEGEKKFAAIGQSVGVNPYDKLAAALTELSTSVLNAFNIILTPIVAFLTKSKLLLASFILSLTKGLVGAALPALSQMANRTAALAQRSAILAAQQDKLTKDQIANSKNIISAMSPEGRMIGNKTIALAKAATTTAEYESVLKRLEKELKSAKAAQDKYDASGSKPNPQKLAAYQAQIDLLQRLQAEIIKVIALEQQSITTVPKARSEKLKEGYYKSTAARFESVSQDRSFANYKEQFKGIGEDNKKLKADVAAMNGQFSSLGRVLTTAATAVGTYGSAAAGASANTTILGKATEFLKARLLQAAIFSDGLAASLIGMASKVKFAALAMFEFMSVAGMVVMVVTLLYQGLKWLYGLFESDASKNYTKALEDATQKTEELTTASEEYSRSLIGRSATITTITQQTEAQANITSQLRDQFIKLSSAATRANLSQDNTIELVDDIIKSNNTLKKQFQEYTKELYKQSQGYDTLEEATSKQNLTEYAAIQLAEKFIETADKKAKAQLNVVKSTQDANQAFNEFINSLKVTSPFSNYVRKLEDVQKALEDAEKQGDGVTAFVNNLKKMSEQGLQLKFIGADAAADAVIAYDEVIQKLKADLDTVQNASIFDGSLLNRGLQLVGLSDGDVKRFEDFQIILRNLKVDAAFAQQGTAYQGQGIISSITDSLDIVGPLYNGLSGLLTIEEKRAIAENKILSEIQRQEAAQKKLIDQAKKAVDDYKRLIQTLANIDVIFATQQGRLEAINKTIEQQGFVYEGTAKAREIAMTKAIDAELDKNSLMIELAKKTVLLYNEGTSDRIQAQAKLSQLEQESIEITARRDRIINSVEARAAQDKINNIQLVLNFEKQILEQRQKQLDLANQEIDANIKKQQIRQKINNLLVTGSEELTAAQELSILEQYSKEKTNSIKQDADLKKDSIKAEGQLIKSQYELLAAQLKTAIALLQIEEEKLRIQADAARAGGRTNEADSLQGAAARLRDIRQGTATASANGITITPGLEALQRAAADAAIAEDTTITRRINLVDRQKEVQLNEFDLQKKTLVTKMHAARVLENAEINVLEQQKTLEEMKLKNYGFLKSIVDSEQIIEENKLKQQNRRKGFEGLTVEQEAKINQQFLSRRLDIINKERDAKIKSINDEYKLLELKAKLDNIQNKNAFERYILEVKQPDAALRDKDPERYTAEMTLYKDTIRVLNRFKDEQQSYFDSYISSLSTAKASAISAEIKSSQAEASKLQDAAAQQIEAALNKGKVAVEESLQMLLDASSKISDIENKIIQSKTEALDNEKTIRENELKALTLRKTGKYELTAMQNFQLEEEFINKKKELINQEYDTKITLIDLEYALLDAQIRFQRAELAGKFALLREQNRDRIEIAKSEKEKAIKANDTKRVAELDRIIKNSSEALNLLSEETENKLTAAMDTAIGKLPEALKEARRALMAERDASLSNAEASTLITQRNPIVESTTSVLPQPGQSFDARGYGESVGLAARGAMQDQLGAVDANIKAIENKIKTALSQDFVDFNQVDALTTKLEELNAQKIAISTGEDPFTNITMGIAGAAAALTPFMETMKSLGPEGEAMAAFTQGTLVIADSLTTLADKSASVSDKIGAVANTIMSIGSMASAAANMRVSAIDQEIEAEKKRDGKSKESQARIAALEKKREAAAKKAFEIDKKMKIASAIMSTAQGAIAAYQALAPIPIVGPALGAAAAAMVVSYGMQMVSMIASTQFQGGGGSSVSTPGSVSMGQRRNTIDLAKSQSASGELGYLQGDKGVGGPENFRPAFIGSRAAGGRVNAGYMVGEQGPELFVPKVPGKIVPADKINNTPPQNVNISITALDASGVEDVLIKQRGHIIGMIREAANSYGEKFLETVDTTVYTQPSKGYGVARA